MSENTDIQEGAQRQAVETIKEAFYNGSYRINEWKPVVVEFLNGVERELLVKQKQASKVGPWVLHLACLRMGKAFKSDTKLTCFVDRFKINRRNDLEYVDFDIADPSDIEEFRSAGLTVPAEYQ